MTHVDSDWTCIATLSQNLFLQQAQEIQKSQKFSTSKITQYTVIIPINNIKIKIIICSITVS